MYLKKLQIAGDTVSHFFYVEHYMDGVWNLITR